MAIFPQPGYTLRPDSSTLLVTLDSLTSTDDTGREELCRTILPHTVARL